MFCEMTTNSDKAQIEPNRWTLYSIVTLPVNIHKENIGGSCLHNFVDIEQIIKITSLTLSLHGKHAVASRNEDN